jgi:hypothetical protein
MYQLHQDMKAYLILLFPFGSANLELLTHQWSQGMITKADKGVNETKPNAHRLAFALGLFSRHWLPWMSSEIRRVFFSFPCPACPFPFVLFRRTHRPKAE